MRQAVKIDNLAKEMIKLAGLKVGEDIDISYTGLRPGEKLYEELLSSKEGNLPTHHEKIMIGKVNSYSHKEVDYLISELLKSIHTDDNAILVSRMKELVPEYVSNNSEFSILDRVTS